MTTASSSTGAGRETIMDWATLGAVAAPTPTLAAAEDGGTLSRPVLGPSRGRDRPPAGNHRWQGVWGPPTSQRCGAARVLPCREAYALLHGVALANFLLRRIRTCTLLPILRLNFGLGSDRPVYVGEALSIASPDSPIARLPDCFATYNSYSCMQYQAWAHDGAQPPLLPLTSPQS
jgi:hypothetical protein